MFWLIKTTIPVFLSTIIIFLLYKNYNKLEDSKKFINTFCFLWFFLFLSHHFILGPNSPIHYYDNADYGVTRYVHDINFHLGGKFLHNIQGGGDYYASLTFGGNYFSLEKFLFSAFPIWIALLLNKFIVLSFNFIGMFFLLNKALHFKKVESLFVSSFVSVINPYTLYSTIHHGIGYAAIPFAVYFYLCRTDKKHYFLITTILSILLSSSMTPVHSFQALYGGLIISYFIIKPAKPIYFLISASLLLLIVNINWSEWLYGMYEYGQLSTRYQSFQLGYERLGSLGALEHLYKKTDLCFINCNIRYSPLIGILIASFISIIAAFNKNYIKLILIIIIINYIPHFIYLILDIDFLNLNNLKSINFINLTWYIIFPISILALKIAANNRNNILNKMSLIFVFFSTIILFTEKFDNAKSVFFEPQKAIYAIKNLTNREWQPNKFFRMVSTNPWESFHPNFLWAYGLETLDGYTVPIPVNFANFFAYGILRQEYSEMHKLRIGGDLYIHRKPLRSVDDEGVDLNDTTDINMLRLSNTGFIASYVKLKENGLKKVSGPKHIPFKLWNTSNIKRDMDFYLNAIKERKKDFITPQDIFIYQIDDYSDRAFFPKKIVHYDQNLNIREQYKFFSDNYKKNHIFLTNKSVKSAKGEVVNISKIPNGYKIELKVFEKGLFVLNQYYLPFWKAYVNGKETNIIPASNIQMAIYLNKDSNQVIFEYSRILLREKILQYITQFKKTYF